MKLVIDIPEEKYDEYKEYVERHVANFAETIIADGTPLPKGHGRLIDAEKLANDVNALKDPWCCRFNMDEYESGRYDSYDYVETITIEDAPTIIEAEKGEEE